MEPQRWDVPVQPDRHALDTVSGDRVAALSSVDGHTIWANSLALQRAGITRDTPDPVGGEIVRDPYGEPTGILRESAQDLLDAIQQDGRRCVHGSSGLRTGCSRSA